jgi:hypothetical protein
MPIGDVSSRARAKLSQQRATGLRFSRDRMVMALDDGREVSIPLRLYPSLLKARPSQRQSWELIGDGRAFHWEELDLDLSVEALVHGLPERIPAPPAPLDKRNG